MLTRADLVAMLVLSTMLLLSDIKQLFKSIPFSNVRCGCIPVLTSRYSCRLRGNNSFKKMKRWRALQPRRFWQQVATLGRMTSSGWRSALLLPFANNTSIV